MLQNAGVFNILTCKCASRHSGGQFFDIKPPKSGPYPSVFSHFHLQMCFAPQRRAILPAWNCKNGSDSEVFCAFWLTNVLRATAACNFSGSKLQKWPCDWSVLCILTSKCASRHSRVPFLNIATSKMAPRMRCFVHFDLQMCFAPQPPAIFEHRNFQNGSANEVFCAFWLANVLRATAACHFSPVCWTAASAPATLARLLFEHQKPRIIEKTQRIGTSLTFRARVPAF